MANKLINLTYIHLSADNYHRVLKNYLINFSDSRIFRARKFRHQASHSDYKRDVFIFETLSFLFQNLLKNVFDSIFDVPFVCNSHWEINSTFTIHIKSLAIALLCDAFDRILIPYCSKNFFSYIFFQTIYSIYMKLMLYIDTYFSYIFDFF